MKFLYTLSLTLLSVAAVTAQNYTNFPYTFGTIGVGGTNASFAHITTDRPRFLFETQILVKTGKIGSYTATQDLTLTTHLTTRATIKATNGSMGLNTVNTLGMMHVRNTTSALPGLMVEQTMANASGVNISMAADSARAIMVQRAGATNFQVMADGRVFAREVEVKLGAFPDYVFATDYKLMSLHDLKSYIAQNGHLPNIPSAAEVAEKGIGMGELTRLQMEKIEELTLHVIALNERIETLEAENETLRSTVPTLDTLAKQIAELQQQLNELKK